MITMRGVRPSLNAIALALCVCLVAGGWLFGLLRSQPSFKGRSLRSWTYEVIQPSGSLSEAITAFQKFGADGVPVLVKLLQRQNSSLRQIYSRVQPTLPAKVRGLLPPASLDAGGIRSRAAAVLGRIEPTAARPAIPNLVRALRDPEPTVRMAVAYTLGNIGRSDRPTVVPALMSALGDPDLSVRLNACSALGQIGPEARQAVPALIDIVRRSDSDLKPQAIIALEKIRRGATAAIPDLGELFHR